MDIYISANIFGSQKKDQIMVLKWVAYDVGPYKPSNKNGSILPQYGHTYYFIGLDLDIIVCTTSIIQIDYQDARLSTSKKVKQYNGRYFFKKSEREIG